MLRELTVSYNCMQITLFPLGKPRGLDGDRRAGGGGLAERGGLAGREGLDGDRRDFTPSTVAQKCKKIK